MMPPELEELLLATLLDLPARERAEHLLRECPDDPAFRRRMVEKLEELRHSPAHTSGAAQDHVGFPGRNVAQALAWGLELGDHPGSFIGRYKLLQKIGEGGCGVVYLAEQQEPVRRRVALKLIKLGLDTREFVARFEAERQALAMMDHPNIARVFDAGATDAGRPFFVMELIRGVPITRYCDENKLSAVERLRLFVAVCQAVQHAHQKGIIHRDLKPSNILVTVAERGPVPKIIDFGIVKAMDVRLTDKSIATQFHSFVGTPAYTSPEQMEMSEMDVDTRTDIYSLGVLLYELLTGRPPFDSDALVKSGLDAMRRTVREVDPRRPSNLLKTLTEEDRSTVARQRSTEASRLSLLLRGDLDWIVMRCLEKKRTRRYATASALATDIECHLNDEPVSARPPSNAYRMRKFVTRHKIGFGAGLAVLLALVIGLITASVALLKARTARERAVVAEQSESVLRQEAQSAKSDETVRASSAAIDLAEHHFAQGRISEGLAALVHAGRKDPRNAVVAPRLLTALASRGFYLPEGPPLAFSFPARSAAFTNDGSEIFLTSQGDSIVRVVDAATGRLKREFHYEKGLGAAAPFSSTGPHVAFPARRDDIFAIQFPDQTILICDALTGARRGPTIQSGDPKDDRPQIPAISPDGRWLVVCDFETAYLYDTETGELRSAMPHEGGVITSVVFSQDSRLLATTALRRKLARLWSAPEGILLHELLIEHKDSVNAIFSPDGQLFALATAEGAQVYDTATGTKAGPFLPHNDVVGPLHFTKDGRKLITAGTDGLTKVWEVATGQLALPAQGHASLVESFRTDAQDKVVFMKLENGDGELVSLVSGTRLAHTTVADRENKWAPCCSPDCSQVVACAADGKIYRLRLSGTLKPLILPLNSPFSSMVEMPGKPAGILWLDATRARALDIASGREIRGGFAYPHSPIDRVVMRKDRAVMVVRIQRDKWEGWWLGASEVGQIISLPELPEPNSPVLSDTGDLVAFARDRTVKVHSLRTGALAGPTIVSETPFWWGSANFDFAGRRLAIGGEYGDARVWDVATGKVVTELEPLRRLRLGYFLFSPDGARLVTSNVDKGEMRLWDASTGRALSPTFETGRYNWSLEYSRDGRLLLSGAWNGTAQVWDAQTGQPLGPHLVHAGRINRARFSVDGTRVVTGSLDQTARVWDTQTGKPLTDALPHDANVSDVEFSSDGRFVFTRTAAAWRIWPLPISSTGVATPEWIFKLATLCASKEFTDGGQFVPVLEQAAKIDELRHELSALPNDAPYVEWGRWFLADPASRSIGPGFRITAAEAEKLSAELAQVTAP